MTDQDASIESVLGDVELLRTRVKNERHGFWFALVLFGILTLGSLGFYWQRLSGGISSLHCPGLGTKSVHCIATIAGTSQKVEVISTCVKGARSCSGLVLSLSGGNPSQMNWLNPGFNLNQSGQWLTLYWSLALIIGFTAVFVFYQHRASITGLRVKSWPAVVIGFGVLALAILFNAVLQPSGGTLLLSGDLWVRGTTPILIMSFGLLALAVLERSIAYMIYALGFIGVALLATLYDVVNFFDWLGIGAPFQGGAHEFPNILLPAAYLLLGGFVTWAVQHDVGVALANDVHE